MAPTQAPQTRGHAKKERTRQTLMTAAAEVIAERGEAFSITDVVERAGVSNGTFYNYFDDRDALVDDLIGQMVGDFTGGAALIAPSDDPALRVATISAMVLAWASTSPAVAQAILRLDVLQRPELDAALFAHLRDDISAGARAGVFSGSHDAATVDLFSGALLAAARRLVSGEAGEGYVGSVLTRLLQLLGVARRKAETIAARAVANTDEGAGYAE